jgi:hypothetical protein
VEKTFNPGDEVIINWHECNEQKGIIVKYNCQNRYWVKLKSGEQFGRFASGNESINNGLEHSFWVGYLDFVERKKVEVYGIVNFCKEHYK